MSRHDAERVPPEHFRLWALGREYPSELEKLDAYFKAMSAMRETHNQSATLAGQRANWSWREARKIRARLAEQAGEGES